MVQPYKSKAHCMSLHLKHNQLVSVDILEKYFIWLLLFTQILRQQIPTRTGDQSNFPGEQNFSEHMANLSIWLVQFRQHMHSPDTELS